MSRELLGVLNIEMGGGGALPGGEEKGVGPQHSEGEKSSSVYRTGAPDVFVYFSSWFVR